MLLGKLVTWETRVEMMSQTTVTYGHAFTGMKMHALSLRSQSIGDLGTAGKHSTGTVHIKKYDHGILRRVACEAEMATVYVASCCRRSRDGHNYVGLQCRK